MSDRKRGIFTTGPQGQRQYLEDGADFEQYKKRSDIRRHVHSALIDGDLLFRALPEEDRERIFNPNKEPTATYTHSQYRVPEANIDGEALSDEILEMSPIEGGIAGLIAFMYEGYTNHSPDYGNGFNWILQNALERVAKRNGWVLESFSFDVKFDKNPNLNELEEKFESGEASINEALTLRDVGSITQEQFVEYAENYTG